MAEEKGGVVSIDAWVERERRDRERFDSLEKQLLREVKVLEEKLIAEKNVADIWMKNANHWRETLSERERLFFPRNMGYVSLILNVALVIVLLFQAFK